MISELINLSCKYQSFICALNDEVAFESIVVKLNDDTLHKYQFHIFNHEIVMFLSH